MKNRDSYPTDAVELRKQAEALAKQNAAQSSERLAPMSPEATKLTLHELRVHQIELEMQNEELLRAQAELDATRERYFDLYDMAPVGYITVSENGLILEANLIATSILGVGRGALTQQAVSQFIHKEDQDIYYLHCKRLFETETPQACELRMVKMDGAEFWARMEATVTQNAADTPMCRVVLSDITARKQAEAALRQSESQYHELFESSSDALFLVDRDTKKVIEANSMASELYGYDHHELLAMKNMDLSAEPEETSRHTHEAKTKLGLVVRIPLRFHRKKDGTVFPVEITARTFLREDQAVIIAACRDITERKQIEEKLRKNEEQFRDVLENSQDASYKRNLQTDTYDYLSPVFARISGYTPEEMKTLSIEAVLNLIHPDDLAQTERVVAESMSGASGKAYQIEYRFKHKEGQYRWFEDLFTVMRDARGHPLARIGSVSDISKRKRVEAEKEKLELQNRQLQRAESLGRMAGAIAHHFNNHLQAVMMNLQMAMNDEAKNGMDAESLTAAMLSARKAAKVSTLMLAYLGQTAAKHEPLYLCDICQRQLPMLEADLPKDMVLKVDFSTPGPVIHANANQIQQVLVNLVTNAWEALGNTRGSIRVAVKTVGAAEIPAENRFPVDWQAQDTDCACLEVTDEGSGIAAADIEKVFDPFFSTKFTGRGLGLSVVLGIVRAHSGCVTVESRPSKGSVFRVFLPLSAEAVPLKSVPVVQAPRSAAGVTVLVVDDEPCLRKSIAIMLKRSGFTVYEAKDGVEAVEVFQKHRDEIGCVLCDLTMPRMDGWETLTELRKLVPDIPVILSSGYSEAQVMAGDHPELPQAFLSKPYELVALNDAIVRFMRKPDRTVKKT